MGVQHGVLMAGERAKASIFAPVQVASKDTVFTRSVRLNKTELPKADLLVLDECHRSLSPTWLKLIKAYPKAFVVGLTATPCRGDGRGLGNVYDDIVIGAKYKDLLADKYLVPCRVYAPSLPDLKGVRSSGGDYNADQLAERMDKPKLIGDVVRTWEKHGAGRQTIVFACGIKHSVHLRNMFRVAGFSAEHVDGSMDSLERDHVIRAFRRGEFDVLCNCAVLTEGFDCPPCSCVVLARPTKKLGLYRQMCLDDKTEVLTNVGWLGMDDPTWDDKPSVATFDDESGEILWCQPKDRYSRPRDTSLMFELQSRSLDIRATDNHTMLVSDNGANWDREPLVETAARTQSFKIPISGLMNTPGVRLTDHEIRLIGWFLSDGCINKSNNALVISQSLSKPRSFHDSIEDSIRGSGLKFTIYKRRRKGRWAGYADSIDYIISKGQPRGTDKHLRGWGHLESYMDKDLADELLSSMTDKQVAVLLEAMNMGDGRTSPPSDGYPRKTMSITTGCNEQLADRLQWLCVTRGFKCNKSVHHYNEQPLYNLQIKRKLWAAVGGTSRKDRPTFECSGSTPDEKVWCMSTSRGSLVTRRNGKVAIVGNSGRLSRPHPGKDDALVIDHSGAVYRFGFPDDDIDWTLDSEESFSTKQEKRTQDKPPIICKKCGRAFTGTRVCPDCGLTMPPPAPRNVATKNGELKELRRRRANREADTQTKQRSWDEAIWKAINMGRKIGVAGHIYRDQYGVWPNASLHRVPRGKQQWNMTAREFWDKYCATTT